MPRDKAAVVGIVPVFAANTRDTQSSVGQPQQVDTQSRRLARLRGLFHPWSLPIATATQAVRSALLQRLSTGSISERAQAALAINMNRSGGQSNTVEGREDPGWRPMLP